MKRLLALLAFVLVCGVLARADRFTQATGSVVKIEGTSTLHAWTMEAPVINGRVDAPAPAQLDSAPATAVVTIPVAAIKSEHAKMDKLMAEALKARQHPEIRYELVDVDLTNGTDAAFATKTKGKLTIAGVTREVEMTVNGSREADGRYVLTGQAPIRMTDYGIKPPTAMLGTIKTGDDVKVTFRWVVAPAN